MRLSSQCSRDCRVDKCGVRPSAPSRLTPQLRRMILDHGVRPSCAICMSFDVFSATFPSLRVRPRASSWAWCATPPNSDSKIFCSTCICRYVELPPPKYYLWQVTLCGTERLPTIAAMSFRTSELCSREQRSIATFPHSISRPAAYKQWLSSLITNLKFPYMTWSRQGLNVPYILKPIKMHY